MEEKFGYEVFLGGNTSGYTFIGEEDGKSYMQEFYKEEKKNDFLQIKRKDKYVYYSYVIYGIANIEGRKGNGEHFNLTLKLSNCCFSDICLLYNTMISIYNNQILNHIIKNSKYTIDNFAAQTTLYRQIEKSFSELIMNSRNLLLPLKDLKPAKSNNIYQCNPEDLSRDLIADLLQKYAIIRVSSTYPTKNATIKSLNENVDHLKEEMLQRENSIREQKDKEISEINNQLQQYKEAYTKQKNKNTGLEDQLQKANDSLQKYKTQGNIKDLLLKLKEQLFALYKYIPQPEREFEEEIKEPKPRHSTISTRLVLLIICIILLGVLIYQVHEFNSGISDLQISKTNIEQKLNELSDKYNDNTITIQDSLAAKQDSASQKQQIKTKGDTTVAPESSTTESNTETPTKMHWQEIIIGVIVVVIGFLVYLFFTKVYKKKHK